MLGLIGQLFLFLTAAAGAVVALRALPRCRVRGRRVRWWLVTLGAAAWIGSPIGISAMGNDVFFDDTGTIIAALWSAAATAFLALAAALLWLAIRFDPARGRRRCPRCWYDMSATPSRTCPECGRTPTREKRLFRTRRSAWPVIVAALATAISYAALKLPRVEVHGWGICIPSTVLIAAFGDVPAHWIEDDNASTWDLWTREVANDLWPWQEEFLQWRAREFIQRSSNFERMGLADGFLDSDTPVRMTESACFEYIRRSIAGDDVPDLDEHLPPVPSIPSQSSIADLLIPALAKGDEQAARNAAAFATLAPLHDAEIAAAIAARWQRSEPRFPSSGTFALALLANRNDDAWTLYLPLVHSEDPSHRARAVRCMVLMKARREAVVALAEHVLDDPDGDICRAAVFVLRNLAPDLLAYRDRLLAIARGRGSADRSSGASHHASATIRSFSGCCASGSHPMTPIS